MQIHRTGIAISQSTALTGAQGSANTKLLLTNDGSMIEYVEEVNCGYFLNGVYKQILLEKDEEGKFLIPGEVYKEDGPMKIAVGLINGSEKIITNALNYIVPCAPNGTVILPAEATWQQLVKDYVDSLIIAGEGYKPDTKVTFTESAQVTDILSGDTIPTVFGKVKKWYTEKISKIGNLANLKTTSKELVGAANELYDVSEQTLTSIGNIGEEIDQLNSNLGFNLITTDSYTMKKIQ